jgi:signal transduction protein with GAF and PtsI domain
MRWSRVVFLVLVLHSRFSLSKILLFAVAERLKASHQLENIGIIECLDTNARKPKEAAMKKQLMNYDTLLQVTRTMSMSREPEKVIQETVECVKDTLDIKGCALFLIDHKTQELEIAASCGLSKDYLNKGPVSALKSIAKSLREGPVAIEDVAEDPRIQYNQAAKEEGIVSILSVPIFARGEVIGAMRVYTGEAWEFTLEDVNFVQAIAQIAGILIDMTRLIQGQKEYIEILTTMHEARDM